MIILGRYSYDNQKREIIPKTKKFGCVGKGDLTFLFKSCETNRSLVPWKITQDTILSILSDLVDMRPEFHN